jgi:Fic family protein
MPIKFKPFFTISPKIARDLIRVEAAKERILHLPLTLTILASLRETARLFTTHYSTMIEGNRLDPQEIEKVLKHEGHFPGRERDEKEVKGYYAALQSVEQWAAKRAPVTETIIRTLHALVMAGGRQKVKPTPYREGQNVIRDGRTRTIVYMPPEAKDVPGLMEGMVQWIREGNGLPCPIIAGIAHYQFATIHPYFDGNGRTARLLTTLILHLGGYDLKGLYSLEEYYARSLDAYYQAISIGPSHNYYMGRAEADITPWIEYFVEGMAIAFENVLKQVASVENQGEMDREFLLRKLDPKQRKVLELFHAYQTVTSHQIGELFGFKPRTASALCKKWVESGFLEIVDFSNKARKYQLDQCFFSLVKS